MKKWPFPGDYPIVRARKMALAYRNLAEQQQAAHQRIREALENLDRRLIAYDNPASLAIIDQALKEFAATSVKDLDDRFTSWGEEWHADQPVTYEPDDMVKAKTAAQIMQVAPKTVSNLRITGRLKGVWDPDMGNSGGYWYKVSDVWEMSTRLRGRNWRSKPPLDTLNDSGSSDSK